MSEVPEGPQFGVLAIGRTEWKTARAHGVRINLVAWCACGWRHHTTGWERASRTLGRHLWRDRCPVSCGRTARAAAPRTRVNGS